MAAKKNSQLNKKSGKNEKTVKKKKKNVVIIGGVGKKVKEKRKNYSAENLNNALDAVHKGVSLRKASMVFKIPLATLSRKYKNPDAVYKKPGPECVLGDDIEKDIAKWILLRAQVGDPVSKAELLDAVQAYVKSSGMKTPFKDGRPNKHWYKSFRKRHPKVAKRKPQKLSHARANVTQEELKQWFAEIDQHMKEKKLEDLGPDRIFNCDETSLPLSPEADTVLAEKGAPNVYKVTDDSKECITLLSTYSASGKRAPPMVMFKYQDKIPKNIIDNLPEDWSAGNSDTGWQTGDTFYEYIANVFAPWLEKEKIQLPVVMYLDNHSSHLTPPLVSFCREKQIELIGLLPNSTHLIQPLDIAFFHPLKIEWRRTLPKWKFARNIHRLKKEMIPLVIKETLDNMKGEKDVVVNGFKAAGLYPFNPKAVDYNILNKAKKRKGVRDEEKSDEVCLETRNQHLNSLENNLHPDLLTQFKNSLQTGCWTGDLKNQGLFEYWHQCLLGKKI